MYLPASHMHSEQDCAPRPSQERNPPIANAENMHALSAESERSRRREKARKNGVEIVESAKGARTVVASFQVCLRA